MAASAEAYEGAAALGLLNEPELAEVAADERSADEPTANEPTPTPMDAEPMGRAAAEPASSSAASFHAQRREALRAKLRINITATMNDRAAPARKAARLASGSEVDGATCAHHAVANIGEEGRKGMDKVLKGKMNITDEQAEADAAKIKALRTSVGWFSSPACSLIYQVSLS